MGNTAVNIFSGTVGSASGSDLQGNVFGCGKGFGTTVMGDVDVVVGKEAGMALHSDFPHIYGNVYCGGEDAAHTVGIGKHLRLMCHNGRIEGSVYGGGRGTTAVVTGDTHVKLDGSVEVMRNVYGGGDRGDVVGNTNLEISD